MNLRARLAPYLVGGGFLLVLLVAWEYFGNRDDSALAAVLPPPTHFLEVLFDSGFRIGLGSQAVSIYQSVASTFFRVFAGMAIAFVAAIFTGAALSLSLFATWCVSPLLYILAPIAPIAWIPTAIVIFGISNTTAIFIVFMGVYFILTIATLAEIRRIPDEFLIVAKNLGATPTELWFGWCCRQFCPVFYPPAHEFHRRLDGGPGRGNGRPARRIGGDHHDGAEPVQQRPHHAWDGHHRHFRLRRGPVSARHQQAVGLVAGLAHERADASSGIQGRSSDGRIPGSQRHVDFSAPRFQSRAQRARESPACSAPPVAAKRPCSRRSADSSSVMTPAASSMKASSCPGRRRTSS